MNQGYSPENFLVFDDNALLVLYCQAVAAVGLAAPLYLLLLQEALGGVEQTLVYGMRATSAASAFLLLVHFVTANMNLRLVLLPRERKPQAPMHAQHALSLLFTTHQMHFAQAMALRWLSPTRFEAQQTALTLLMVAAHAALYLLARSWGAVRCTWTAGSAAKALEARPAAAKSTLAIACRYFLAASFFVTYAVKALEHARGGHLASHAAVGAVAYAGGWVHALVSWRHRRNAAKSTEVARPKDE